MHTMIHTSPCQRPNEPVPGDQYDYDDEVVADGMCDDDDDCPPFPQLPAPLGLQQASLWDEAIARIRASKSRGEPPSSLCRITRPRRAR
jgi:hypothetical protein